ncbi:L-threonylcarbamoyladenylate synthase [Aurantimonas sp. VKM B-3413]|uniref:L-threonylcarbamoyladenylate synthase n=1 Tax=Aurantimonas sp. VKM B-3413 TaxID=2779401 RepID=UPI001E4D1827|nr:threonylcarbamoyl-AMP synthase [Aurantimonas sp. VKM B-3413]
METEILTLSDPAAEERALALLDAGDLVALPTETVYGLAADATQGVAVAKIFAAKGRPSFNPLICHVFDLAQARGLAVVGRAAEDLAAAFWPGPLTIVLPLAPGSPVHPLATAGLATVALRAPQGVAARLAQVLGRPLAAPSANPSGRVSATSAGQVLKGLGGKIPLILDGGASSVGVESTIVMPQADHLVLLRPGLVTRAALADASGLKVRDRATTAGVTAPGQLASHYAPAGRVRLDATRVEPGEYLIGFGPEPVAGQELAADVINLSPSGDPVEAAARLFAALAAFDSPDIAAIAVAPIPAAGLGEAINDRLRRAAAPRT